MQYKVICTVDHYTIHTVARILKIGNRVTDGVHLEFFAGHFRYEAEIRQKEPEVRDAGEPVGVHVVTQSLPIETKREKQYIRIGPSIPRRYSVAIH